MRFNAASLTLAPSLIAASSEFALIPYLTDRHSFRILASCSEFTGFEQMSIRARRLDIIQLSLINRTIIAIASPCLVLPSNITETSLVPSALPGKVNSCFTLSVSCLKMRDMYCPRLELPVRRYQFFSRRGRRVSILWIGILALRNSSTTSCRYARSVKGNVLSF